MKEKINWKIIATILIIGLVCFGAGYAVGISTGAKFILSHAINFLEYKNISIGADKAELYSYYLKLKHEEGC